MRNLTASPLTTALALVLATACAGSADDGMPASPGPAAPTPAPTPETALAALASLPIRPLDVKKIVVPEPTETSGGIGNALAWDARDGAFWMVTDQQPAGTDPWLLHLYRVRLGAGGAQILEVIPIRENGRHLKGGDLDPEGIAIAPDGTLWVVDEGAPALLHVSRRGEVTRRIDPDDLLRNRENNRGLEGIALGNDGRTLFAVLQNGVQMEKDKVNTFLSEYDLAAGRWTHHPYRLEDPAAFDYPAGLMIPPRMGAHDLHAIGPRTLLVLERDNQSGAAARVKRVFKVEVPTAVGTAPLAKTLVVDLVALGYRYEQPEGITMRAPRLLSISNDNDALPEVPTELWEIAF